MVEEVTEANLVWIILKSIGDGHGTNAYFLHSNLPKAFREKFSHEDVLILFNKLEWNVKVIEIDHVSETQARYPWRPCIGIATGIVPKKIISYRIRPAFVGWNILPNLFDKILENLHQEDPTIDFTGFPSTPNQI